MSRDAVRFLRDPVLLILGAVGVLHTLYFLSDVGDNADRIIVVWAMAMPLDVTLAVMARRTAQVQPTTPGRRFWRTLANAALLVGIGDGIHFGLILRDPTIKNFAGGPIQVLCFGIAMVAMTVVMFRHPITARSRGERVRVSLDALTVVVGGAVLAWALAADPHGGPVDVPTVVGGATFALVSLFAAFRVMLSGSPPLTQSAAIPMIAAMFLQVVAVYVTPTGTGEDISPMMFLIRTWPAILVVIGPRILELQIRAAPAIVGMRQRKPYSPLPYVAIASTFLILIVLLPGGVDTRLWGVVAGTLLITALVVVRQLLAFHDNRSLINRLDAALLELREHQTRLRYNASHDALTGLLNRNGLGEHAADALRECADPSEVALLLVDLDDFKTINDTRGHVVGDGLLVAVAARLRAAVRPHDVVARLDGDEFAVLLRGATGADANIIGERILASLSHPVDVGGQDLRVRSSIGSTVGGPHDDLASLLRNADVALYEAKDRGSGRHVWYAADMKARLFETAELGSRLRDAFNAAEFRLVYQPIVQFDDGRIVGVEALLRWHRPDTGVLLPEEFITVAERTGLIVPLGRWVLREACLEAASWLRTFGADVPMSMSVNVSGRQFREPGFVDDVAAALADTGLPPERLTIEVIETTVLDGGQANKTLHELRALGVRLALDDFGTAASSLGLLLTCPVTSLKLDRSFVEGIVTTTRQAAVATAVVQIAQALDLDLVAEGIETREQAELLQQLGYRHAQGFMYYHPLPAPDLHRLWRAGPSAWPGSVTA